MILVFHGFLYVYEWWKFEKKKAVSGGHKKNDYFRTKLKNSNNPDIFLGTVYELTVRTTKITSSYLHDILLTEILTQNMTTQLQVADEFNDYLYQVGYNLAMKID